MNRNAFAAAAKLGAASAIAAAAILSISRPAAAQVTFTYAGPGDSEAVNMTTNGGQSYTSVYAGRYQGNINGASSNTAIFCVDPMHEIAGNDSYIANVSHNLSDAAGARSGDYYNGGLASILSSSSGSGVTFTSAASKASAVSYLADTYLGATSDTFATNFSGSTNFDDNLTAISLSIWDIEVDGGDGVGSGNFQTSDSSLASLVSYYEGEANGAPGYASPTAVWLQSPIASDGSNLQSFAVAASALPNIAPAPVPEPGVFVTGFSLAGMTGLGLIRGRRRRTTKTDAEAITPEAAA